MESSGELNFVLDKTNNWHKGSFFHQYSWLLSWEDGTILHEEQYGWVTIDFIYHKLLCAPDEQGILLWKFSNGKYFGCWNQLAAEQSANDNERQECSTCKCLQNTLETIKQDK